MKQNAATAQLSCGFSTNGIHNSLCESKRKEPVERVCHATESIVRMLCLGGIDSVLFPPFLY